ncbi:TrkA C-terminal domain-containing protein [candidate division CSSED10-310 bacterium]|uniref:TrkA C-terminal domain-containing protein n=1 Tax=candidate division CSSED10-310 bacterium TaxID=2855610 RepID=A0ABV6YV83_UNCC1
MLIAETIKPNLSVGYGITYPYGLLGLLILIQFLPRLMHVDLKEEADKIKGVDLEEEEEENHAFLTRIYSVQNQDLDGKTLKELNLRKATGILILTIKHGKTVKMAHADSVLRLDDHVMAEGRLNNLIEFEDYMGQEVMDDMIYEHHHSTAPVVINRRYAVNRSISELKLAQNLDIIVTRIQRGGIDLGIHPDIALERGDIITLTETA